MYMEDLLIMLIKVFMFVDIEKGRTQLPSGMWWTEGLVLFVLNFDVSISIFKKVSINSNELRISIL